MLPWLFPSTLSQFMVLMYGQYVHGVIVGNFDDETEKNMCASNWRSPFWRIQFSSAGKYGCLCILSRGIALCVYRHLLCLLLRQPSLTLPLLA